MKYFYMKYLTINLKSFATDECIIKELFIRGSINN